jgi:RNA polymerase sigma-70 factor (ECF subfamily)
MQHSDTGTILRDLARKAGTGDEAALEELLAAVHVHVMRYLRSWLHRSREWEEWAQDLAQDSLIRIAGTIGGFRGVNDRELLGWCFTIARNHATDRLRVLRDRAEAEELRLEIGWGVSSASALRDVDEERGSEALQILLRLLREAQSAEPEASQELLWRHVVLHDSWREAGEAMGIPATSAKRRFQRAQERIRMALLRGILRLPPDQLTVVRRWLARADVEDAA